MTEKLEPCGNCGAPARWVKLAWRIKCTRPSCGVEGGKFATKPEAITAWNLRSNQPADVARQPFGEDWCIAMAKVEGDAEIGAGHKSLPEAIGALSKRPNQPADVEEEARFDIQHERDMENAVPLSTTPTDRDDVIEMCAKVAENYPSNDWHIGQAMRGVAAAIRALKGDR